MKILIIDDDSNARKTLSKIFKIKGEKGMLKTLNPDDFKTPTPH